MPNFLESTENIYFQVNWQEIFNLKKWQQTLEVLSETMNALRNKVGSLWIIGIYLYKITYNNLIILKNVLCLFSR